MLLGSPTRMAGMIWPSVAGRSPRCALESTAAANGCRDPRRYTSVPPEQHLSPPKAKSSSRGDPGKLCYDVSSGAGTHRNEKLHWHRSCWGHSLSACPMPPEILWSSLGHSKTTRKYSVFRNSSPRCPSTMKITVSLEMLFKLR
jgi:hypothetical protein